MAATSQKEYKELKVTGPVSVERVDSVGSSFWNILIMGPTGAGKSTFIEALGLGETARISSNGLEGFTQTISTYRINNVFDTGGDTIYLVDSPGFADTKISEMAIVSMLQKWLNVNRQRYFHRILYLTPITHVCLPGSQRQVLRTFEALTGVDTAKNITIVTTMWDAIWGERARIQAEETYRQLKMDIWKGFIEKGGEMVKFYNTQKSALLVLDGVFSQKSENVFHIENRSNLGTLRETSFAVNLFTDLQNRIQNQELESSGIQSDLEYAEAQDNHILQSILRPRLEDAQKLLETFQGELQDFGAPPPGYHRPNPIPEPAPLGDNIDEGVLGTIGPHAEEAVGSHEPNVGSSEHDDAAHVARTPILPSKTSPLLPLPSSSSPVVASDIAHVSIPTAENAPSSIEYPSASVPNGLPSTHATVPAPSAPQSQALDSAHATEHPQRGRLSRALDVIFGCGCCGKGVEVNHDA